VLDVKSARELVLKHTEKVKPQSLPTETVPVLQSVGRIIAEPVSLDTDQPPFDRSMRDGYAVKARDVKDVPASLRCVAEIRAGDCASLQVREGQAVQIMTGAPLPLGADAVVMVEYTRQLDHENIRILKSVRPGDSIAPRGSEHKAGEQIIGIGKSISSIELAVLASVGKSRVKVFRRPAVSILATGDELVDVNESPGPGQIRNSNSFSLYAQVLKCGALPRFLATAKDNLSGLKDQMQQGLASDVLLVSGGVSMGKYDLVEQAFRELGIEAHFTSVSLRPGKPTVFATLGERYVFGLPGNPVSTFVTFELFVKPVLNKLQGVTADNLSLVKAVLQHEVTDKSGRTSFLPARVFYRSGNLEAFPVYWKGSADIFGMVGANGFVIVPLEVTRINAGEQVEALLFDELNLGLEDWC
jgi:molybdopterin molybdotransferase